MIKDEIEVTRKEWNQHRVRKQRNRNCFGGKPNELYDSPVNFGARDCRMPLDKQCIEILLEKYTKTPALFPKKFEDVANVLGKKSNPTTASDAFKQYVEIIDAIDSR